MKSVKSYHPQGFTLIEITFSIAFLTMILATVLAGFIGIMGLYNRSQGLGLTATAARNSLNTLTEDLRQTTKVEFFSGPGANDTFGNANPRSAPFPSAPIKTFYCLTSDTRQIGYGLVRNATSGRFHLTRFEGSNGANGCSSLERAQQLVGDDLWSDSSPSLPEPPSKDYRPFVITRANANPALAADAPVWQLRVSVHRGSRIPGVSGQEFLTDQFSAETTLQTTVLSRP